MGSTPHTFRLLSLASPLEAFKQREAFKQQRLRRLSRHPHLNFSEPFDLFHHLWVNSGQLSRPLPLPHSSDRPPDDRRGVHEG